MTTEDKLYQLFAKSLGFACLLGLLSACHKDPVVDAKVPTRLVKTTVSTAGAISTVTTYQYDIQGRIIRNNRVNPDCSRCGAELGNELNVYAYYNDKLTQADKVDLTNSLTGKHTFTLNKWGFAIADYLLGYNMTFTHDENGFLLLRKIPALSGPLPFFTITQKVKDQNIIERSNDSGYDRTTTTYEYDLSHLARLDPLHFLEEGKQSRNLMTKETSVTEYRDGTTLTVITHYSYQFDKQDRVIEQRMTTINPFYTEPIVWVNTFEYST